MTAEMFLENFDWLVELPGGVEKLRGLILQLAIQGTLTERREARRRNQEKRPTATSAHPFVLPENWQWVRVADVGDVQLGRQRAPEHHHGPNMVPYLRVQNVFENRIDTSDVKTMNFSPEEQITFGLRHSDILLNEGQSQKLVGRPAIYRNEIPGACFQNTLIRFRANSNVLANYALVVFLCYLHNGRFQRSSQQTTNIAHLGAGRFAQIEFPLPPIPDQHHIIASVTELHSLCDALEAHQTDKQEVRRRLNDALIDRLVESADSEEFDRNWQRLRDQFDILCDSASISRLREAIVQLAIEGKLSHGRKDRAGWVLTEFGKLAAITSGVTLGRKVNEPTILYPYLRVANVQRWGLDLREVKTTEVTQAEIERYTLTKGDILLTEGGDWDKVGRTAIWNDEIPNCIHQNHVFRARLHKPEAIRERWIEIYMNSSSGRSYFGNASKQTTNLASINMTQLRGCPVPIPSIQEQDFIIERYRNLLSLCDALEARLQESLRLGQALLSSVVKHILDPASPAPASSAPPAPISAVPASPPAPPPTFQLTSPTPKPRRRPKSPRPG